MGTYFFHIKEQGRTKSQKQFEMWTCQIISYFSTFRQSASDFIWAFS